MRREIRFFVIWLMLLFLFPCTTAKALTVYRRTGLTGGTSDDLDGIDGDNLAEGQMGMVFRDANSTETLYFYRLNATSGAAESVPDIITPDTDPGSKRWILQSIYLDVLHGLTASVAELNILDGVTATYTEINTVADGSTAKNSHTHVTTEISKVTADPNEINALDGITSSTAELNILDGVTATYTEINTVADGSTAKNSHTHTLAIGASDVTATYTEINTVAAGSTAKNSHTHITTEISKVTADPNEINVLDGITVTTAQLNAAGSGDYIGGDGTAGRKLKSSIVSITGVDADTITVEMFQTEAGWGDEVAVDTLDKAESATNYDLSADGKILSVKNVALTGTCICTLSAYVYYDDTSIAYTSVNVDATSDDIYIYVFNLANTVDLCTIPAGKKFNLQITYITSQ